MQRCGQQEVSAALANEEVNLVFILEDGPAEETGPITQLAEAAGIEVKVVNVSHMRRMARVGVPSCLALVGRKLGGDLAEVMARPGPIVLLSGVSYALNIGYTIRTSEVSGATAVVVDTPLNSDGRKTAVRASMRSDRVMPVFWQSSLDAVVAAKSAGRRVIAVEDCGTVEPWDVDLSDDGGAPMLIVGAEGVGIPQEVLDLCDEIVIIPMAGFYPCYNLQAPMAVMLVECLRQRRERQKSRAP